MHYYDETCFADIYLEDSYVLAIEEAVSTLSLVMELVLLESHSLYVKPASDEAYCYRNAHIHFCLTQRVIWHQRSVLVSRGANGDTDLGNVDVFRIEGATYHLKGDWGSVSVTCGTVLVDYEGSPHT
ncbi:hypothetical protein [Pseudomonas syringae]|uniref:Uncharacterized protein n=1 Tax=Pseudomonas syringae pv. actinidiae TaxID=103796 RepID=A0A7Z6XZT1_PSESF|nr:hypothetical protein [Pseudomonas syringae]RMP84013.1 hypothetical protein ALQ15_04318 [Pseudomonas syringae pv. actinidiae]